MTDKFLKFQHLRNFISKAMQGGISEDVYRNNTDASLFQKSLDFKTI